MVFAGNRFLKFHGLWLRVVLILEVLLQKSQRLKSFVSSSQIGKIKPKSIFKFHTQEIKKNDGSAWGLMKHVHINYYD